MEKEAEREGGWETSSSVLGGAPRPPCAPWTPLSQRLFLCPPTPASWRPCHLPKSSGALSLFALVPQTT